MKKNFFITLFIGVHISFFFLQIHKQMQFIKESFTKQRNEQTVSKLIHKKQAKLNELHALQSRQEVASYAQKKLAMRPVLVTQLNRYYEQS